MTAVRGYELEMSGESGVILCAREFQNSLDESSMEEVKQAIRSVDWLNDFYEIGEKYIRSKSGNIRYVFSGLRHNLDSIKSKARILLCWIDEAEPVSEVAYRKLLPTIREEKSECWLTWNPEHDGSPTDRRFIKEKPENAVGVEINYTDNPWFPKTLESERLKDQQTLDPATYSHIWEGKYLENSEAQILNGKVRVSNFDIDKLEQSKKISGPYYGLDYGFANDPTAFIEAFIDNDTNTLYVTRECGGVGLELDKTAAFAQRYIPEIEKYVIRADNARPESTSYLKRHGLPRVESAPKWQGSVEDGIRHLRSYAEIVVHESCKKFIEESRMYSYKTDRNTGDVLPIPIDAHNHYIDALRYALSPLIKRNKKKAGAF